MRGDKTKLLLANKSLCLIPHDRSKYFENIQHVNFFIAVNIKDLSRGPPILQ